MINIKSRSDGLEFERKKSKEKLLDIVKNIKELSEVHDKFINEYKTFVLNVMARDIPNVSAVERNEIATYMVEFIESAIEKGYIDSSNMLFCLERIINTSSSFSTINDVSTFGNCILNVEFGFNYFNGYFRTHKKHIVFHEMAHSIGNLVTQDLGKYKEKFIIKQRTDIIQVQRPTISINSDINKYLRIIHDNMLVFLDEIIAESMACDLLNDYLIVRTELGNGITSDWVTPYNQRYQQLGYEFLKTLYDEPKDERGLFKRFSLDAINKNNIIASIIMNIYAKKNPSHWKDDLFKITKILGSMTVHSIYNNITSDEIRLVKALMKKYNPGIITISEVHYSDGTPGIITIRQENGTSLKKIYRNEE